MIRQYFMRTVAVGAALTAGVLLAQPPTEAVAFEVATIRPAPSAREVVQRILSGNTSKLGMSVDGARVDLGFQSLAELIRIAYRVRAYQVQGPDWMSQQLFEIQGKIPDGISPDKLPDMLQAPLAERFKLTIHRDKRDLPVYALIVGKNGPRLTEASSDPDAPLPDSAGGRSIGTEKGPMKIVPDGKGGTIMQGGPYAGTVRETFSASGLHVELTKADFPNLVDLLTDLVDRPVLDMTGLKGRYRISMDLPMGRPPGSAPAGTKSGGRGFDSGRVGDVHRDGEARAEA